MTEIHGEVIELAERAGNLPDGPSKVSLLEEAVRLADTTHDVELAYNVRMDLIQAAAFSARGDLGLVAFAWCLSQHDRLPGTFDTRQLLWIYKWVIDTCVELPEVPRGRVETVMADFESRCRSMNYSLYAIDLLRRDFFMITGERDAASLAHNRFRRRRRDALSDCAACVASRDCRYYQFQRRWSLSLRAAAPVFAGNLKCRHQPHRILAHVLFPALRLGRYEEASDYHQRGYRLVSSGRQFVDIQAEHLRFLVVIGQLDKATTLVERHIADALATFFPLERFEFLLSCALWCEQLIGAGKHSVKVRLPEAAPAADSTGGRDLDVCRDWFMQQARAIADQFDARNGTDAFRRRIDELPELLQLGPNRPKRTRTAAEPTSGQGRAASAPTGSKPTNSSVEK